MDFSNYPNLKTNTPLSSYTTIGIGGAAKYFLEISSEDELLNLSALLNSNTRPPKPNTYFIGEGSNLIVSDEGFDGLIVKIAIKKFEIHPCHCDQGEQDANVVKSHSDQGEQDANVVKSHSDQGEQDANVVKSHSEERAKRVTWESFQDIEVGAGNNLLETIMNLDQLGLSGMEKMAGIPGSVGGAIYGNAGAYGQEIKDSLLSVRFFDGKEIKELETNELNLGYRMSIFKKNKNWIILSARFRLKKVENPSSLIQTSKGIINLRELKYKPGLKCPGSFFKNIILSDLTPQQLEKVKALVEKERLIYGKVASGVLLDLVGAKGMEVGDAKVAKHHGNLIYNAGNATCQDVKKLSAKLKELVFEKFGIILEEEVQYL